MALRLQKVICLFRPAGFRLSLLEPSKLSAAVGVKSGQVAHLTSTHGQPVERPKPWPYEKRPYNSFYQFIDHTRKRFDDNTKVIVVDGNLAVGKTAFAEKVAKEFDMKFFPDCEDSEIFIAPSGFDIRELNEQLPPGARLCDFSTFYTQNAPKSQLAKIGMTQCNMYYVRFHNYVRALEHLLNTGQGVVIERSPWSDFIFADTLKKLGYMTPAGHAYYTEIHNNTVCELWQPHVVMYLDAPISHVRDAINKRNIPWEVNSKVLNNDFLQSLESVYKKKILPYYSKYGEVLNYDLTDLPDWEIIVEELEALNLDQVPDDEPEKFSRWSLEREDDWNCYRMSLASKWQLSGLFNLLQPFDARELFASGENFIPWKRIVETHPELIFSPGYNPEKGSTLFKL